MLRKINHQWFTFDVNFIISLGYLMRNRFMMMGKTTKILNIQWTIFRTLTSREYKFYVLANSESKQICEWEFEDKEVSWWSGNTWRIKLFSKWRISLMIFWEFLFDFEYLILLKLYFFVVLIIKIVYYNFRGLLAQDT